MSVLFLVKCLAGHVLVVVCNTPKVAYPLVASLGSEFKWHSKAAKLAASAGAYAWLAADKHECRQACYHLICSCVEGSVLYNHTH
jgi:hypothetical protein